MSPYRRLSRAPVTAAVLALILVQAASPALAAAPQRTLPGLPRDMDATLPRAMKLLELSRIGRVKNPSEVIPFNVIVEEALKLIEGQRSSTRPEIRIMPDMPSVYGDHRRLLEVVQNLLDNAIKFSSQSEDPCIEVGVRTENRETIFDVKDNGIGIPPAYHDQVFGLFNKLDASAEGTGVGLALVKRIIDVHGGRIWIESDGSNGATFCFTLPEGPQ